MLVFRCKAWQTGNNSNNGNNIYGDNVISSNRFNAGYCCNTHLQRGMSNDPQHHFATRGDVPRSTATVTVTAKARKRRGRMHAFAPLCPSCTHHRNIHYPHRLSRLHRPTSRIPFRRPRVRALSFRSATSALAVATATRATAVKSVLNRESSWIPQASNLFTERHQLADFQDIRTADSTSRGSRNRRTNNNSSSGSSSSNSGNYSSTGSGITDCKTAIKDKSISTYLAGTHTSRHSRGGITRVACVAGLTRIIALLRLVMSLGPLSFLVRPIVLNEPVQQADSETSAHHPSRQNGPTHNSHISGKNKSADISAELRARIQDLYVDHVTEQGVDYDALVKSNAFAHYKTAVAKLRNYDLSQLKTDSMRIAFYVNLYNALTIHSFAALGPPAENSVARLFFNSQVCYHIAGMNFSLTDMENGILRANRGVSLWPRPFGKGDDRLRAMVDHLDPRIHFVLNCGAASCPPIRFLTPDQLDDQMSRATRSFLRSSSNFNVETSKPTVANGHAESSSSKAPQISAPLTVELSAIFRWYRIDFAPDDSDLSILRFVVDNAGPDNDRAHLLAAALESGDVQDVCIKYAPYDWSLNSYKAAPRTP